MARFVETSLTIRHKDSAETLNIQLDPANRSIFRFRHACAGLDRIISKQNLTLYFLTLTVRDENIDAVNRDLNKSLNWARNRFRRAGLPFTYVWVVELQKKRYKKHGVKALHWHFAIGCADHALPHSEKRGRRMRLVEDGTVIGTKDIRKPEWATLRRFGSSQFSYFGWAK